MKGVPLVVVFEISPSHIKTFHYPPQHFNHHHDLLPAAVRRLCVGSAESEDQQVRRPHHVQVQSPISRTFYIYSIEFIGYFARIVFLLIYTRVSKPFPRALQGLSKHCLRFLITTIYKNQSQNSKLQKLQIPN